MKKGLLLSAALLSLVSVNVSADHHEGKGHSKRKGMEKPMHGDKMHKGKMHGKKMHKKMMKDCEGKGEDCMDPKKSKKTDK